MSRILMWIPSLPEMAIILIVGLLVFGRRLPEVGRSLGKAIVEFKKGIRDVEGDLDTATRPASPPARTLPTNKLASLPQAAARDTEDEKPGVSSPD